MARYGIKRERILRVLLNTPDGTLSKYRIAKRSDCSNPWVLHFLGRLERAGWTKGTKVLDAPALFDYWRRIHRPPRRFDFLVQDPESVLLEASHPYALTTYAADMVVEHYLFASRFDVYVHDGDFDSWKHTLLEGERALVGSGNFRLLSDDPHVFYDARQRHGLTVVSLPQLILDLSVEGGVCADAAERLMKRVIGSAV